MSPTCPDACCDDGGPGRSGVSRRAVLAAAGLGLGAASLSSGGLSPVSVSAARAAPGTAYTGDTLVVLSLRGGFDGLSALAPLFDPAYALARPSIAVPASKALRVDRGFGLHPQMKPLLPVWKAGRLGAVVAVGQPGATRSHFAATEELERSAPGTSIRTGWLDRTLGLRGVGRPLQAVSIGGPSRALQGPAPDVVMQSLDGFTLLGDAALRARRARASDRMYPDARSAAAATQSALREAGRVRSETKAGHGYPAGPLGQAMSDVARLIKGDAGVQVVTVDYGDWDHHANLGTIDSGRMRTQLGELASVLAAFDADMGAGMKKVSLVTLSEFGRRVTENGSRGTDHGKANTVLLLGGGVIGNKVHGAWPGLKKALLDDGDLAVRTDVRNVLAEVLHTRCGVTDLAAAFPGLRYRPVGAMRAR